MPPSSASESYLNTSTIIAIVSTAALVYTQWSNLPEWVFKGRCKERGGDTNKDANDDLATPNAVMDKLVEMMDIVGNVSDVVAPTDGGSGFETKAPEDDDMTRFQMIAALYSLVHLHREFHAKDHDYRNNLYDDDRKDDDVGLEEMKELGKYLEYAHWAYESSNETISRNCRAAGLDLLRHDPATEPGRVGHFVALDHGGRLAIVGLKGTSTLSDILTDLMAIPKEHVGCNFGDEPFEVPPENDDNVAQAASTLRSHEGVARAARTMRCHEGIFTAAIWVADSLQPMIENLLVPLKYKVVICGHSLGAGTSCLLGLELRSRIPAFRRNYTNLRVLAYASPPVLSYWASKACAPFVTSVVNNSDVIPRSSVSNLVVMSKLLGRINQRLEANNMAFDSWASLKRYYDEHTIIDEELLLTEEELDAFFAETHASPEEDCESLFVPGRIVALWDRGANHGNEIGGIVTDCGMKQLRQIELSLSLITDHLVDGYRTNITKLICHLENNI